MAAITSHLREKGREYFPAIGKDALRVEPEGVHTRDVTRIHLFRLRTDGLERRVVVKVWLEDDATGEPGDKPAHEREFATLRTLERVFGQGDDPRFGAVRALDCIPGERAVVMVRRDEPTLLARLLSAHRARGASGRDALVASFHSVGAWLQRFHELEPFQLERFLYTTREELVEAVSELTAPPGATRAQRELLQSLGQEVDRVARDVLPSQLELVLSHADFGPQNVFVGEPGRVIIFDTLGTTRMPRQRDLAYFLFVLRSLTVDHYARGAFYSRPWIDRCAQQFLAGYHGGEDVPLDAIRLFEVHSLLSKWHAGAESQKRAKGLRNLVKSGRMFVKARAFERYGARLLEDLRGRRV